jgi:uncharacterized membrane protein YesL
MSEDFNEKISKGKFYRLGDKLGDIMILSLLWLICSLPVITMGTASSALYYAVHKRFYDRSETPARDFWRSFKQNLKQGIPLNLVLLIYGAVASFNIYFAIAGFNGLTLPTWYAPIAGLLALPFLCTVPYTFPYLARFKGTFKNILFHSFTFATMYPKHTFLVWLYILVSLALMIVFFPSLLFMPFTCCYLCWRALEKDFGYALILKDKREHPERYAEENAAKSKDKEDLEDEDKEEEEKDGPDEESDGSDEDDSDDDTEDDDEESEEDSEIEDEEDESDEENT